MIPWNKTARLQSISKGEQRRRDAAQRRIDRTVKRLEKQALKKVEDALQKETE
jgi:hypothetical protein